MNDEQNNAHRLKVKAASGFVYSTLAQATKLITQFLAIVVTARLIAPEEFGVMAMVSPVYALACMWTDLGISQAVLNRKDITESEMTSLFWVNVTLGLVCMLLIICLSSSIGRFYNDERTEVLSIAMATLVALGSMGAQHGALIMRELNFRSQSLITVSSSLIGLLVTILAALVNHTYWSLFIGMAATSLAATAGTWISCKWRPSRPSFDRRVIPMLRYGIGITAGNLMNFFVQHLSGILVGRAFGSHTLGLFDRSTKLLATPLQQVVIPISGVIVPLLHRLHGDDERYRRVYIRAVCALTALIGPGVVWAVVCSKSLIIIVLGTKWEAAAPLFAALSFAALPQFLNGTAKWLLLTQGRAKHYAKQSSVSSIVSISLLLISIPFGITVVAYSRVVHQLLITPYVWISTCQQGPVKLSLVAKQGLPCLFGLCLGAIVCYWAIDLFPDSLYVGTLFCLVACYSATFLSIVSFPSGRSQAIEIAGFFVFAVNRGANRFVR